MAWAAPKTWAATDIIADPAAELNRIENNCAYIENGLAVFSNIRNAPLALNQKVSNGNFVNTTGWTALNATLSATANTLSITGNGGNAKARGGEITTTNWVASKQVYVKFRARVTGTGCQYLNYDLRTAALGGTAISSNNITNPVQNQWYGLGFVGINTTNTGKIVVEFSHAYANAAAANGKVLEVQYVMGIDLTVDFGAGNEPTAAVMDDYMQAFPPNNWFDTMGVIFIPSTTSLMTFKTDWAQTDYPTTAQAKNIDDNIKTFANLYYLSFTYRDWLGIVLANHTLLNEWEQTLSDLYTLATDGITEKICGTFNCGE